MTLFLTRRQHDELIDLDPSLLLALFDQSERTQWSLAGVEFMGLPLDLCNVAERMTGQTVTQA